MVHGELVAGQGRAGDFYKLAPQMMAKRRKTALTFVAFDVGSTAQSSVNMSVGRLVTSIGCKRGSTGRKGIAPSLCGSVNRTARCPPSARIGAETLTGALTVRRTAADGASMRYVYAYDQHEGTDHADGPLSDDAIILETLTSPSDDRGVPVVIMITLLLTLVVAFSGQGGSAASLVLCGLCAALAKVKAAGRFWTWLPAALTAASAVSVIVQVA